jgi:hypothetical protein
VTLSIGWREYIFYGIDESDGNVWNSCLFYLNFSSISTVELEFNSKFINCQRFQVSQLYAIQTIRKNLQVSRGETIGTIIELIHSDICKMNGVLIKGGQRYLSSWLMTHLDIAIFRICLRLINFTNFTTKQLSLRVGEVGSSVWLSD